MTRFFQEILLLTSCIYAASTAQYVHLPDPLFYGDVQWNGKAYGQSNNWRTKALIPNDCYHLEVHPTGKYSDVGIGFLESGYDAPVDERTGFVYGAMGLLGDVGVRAGDRIIAVGDEGTFRWSKLASLAMGTTPFKIHLVRESWHKRFKLVTAKSVGEAIQDFNIYRINIVYTYSTIGSVVSSGPPVWHATAVFDLVNLNTNQRVLAMQDRQLEAPYRAFTEDYYEHDTVEKFVRAGGSFTRMLHSHYTQDLTLKVFWDNLDRRVDWSDWSRNEFWGEYKILQGNCQHFLMTMMLSAKPFIRYPRWLNIATLKEELVQNAPKMLFNPKGLFAIGVCKLASDVVSLLKHVPPVPRYLNLETCPAIQLVGLGSTTRCPESKVWSSCYLKCNEPHFIADEDDEEINICTEDRRWSFHHLPKCQHEGCPATSLTFDDAAGNCEKSLLEGTCLVSCLDGVEESTFHCVVPVALDGQTLYTQKAVWAGRAPNCDGGMPPQSYYFEFGATFCDSEFDQNFLCTAGSQEGCEVACDKLKGCTGLNAEKPYQRGMRIAFTNGECEAADLVADAASSFWKRPLPKYIEYNGKECSVVIKECSSPFRIGCEDECDDTEGCSGLNYSGGKYLLTGTPCDILAVGNGWFFRKPHRGCWGKILDFDDSYGRCYSGRLGDQCEVECWDGDGGEIFTCELRKDIDGHDLWSQPSAEWMGKEPAECNEMGGSEFPSVEFDDEGASLFPSADGVVHAESFLSAPFRVHNHVGFSLLMMVTLAVLAFYVRKKHHKSLSDELSISFITDSEI